SADPSFVSAGSDEHLQSGSPAIDRGDPASYSLQEALPSGGRADLGAYGNTAQSTPSASPQVQVLSPSQFDKVQARQQVTVRFRSDGLMSPRPVALINAGGSAVGAFGPDTFFSAGDSFSSNGTITQAVDASRLADPVPQGVLQSYARTSGLQGATRTYQL